MSLLHHKELLEAVKNGDLKHCCCLLNIIDTPDIRDVDNNTALYIASQNGDLDVCRLLLTHGADVNAKNGSSQWTSLHIAANFGHLNICTLLLDHGADIDAKITSDWTPLHIAVHSNELDVCLSLMDRGAKFDDKNYFGDTALGTAVKRDYMNLSLALIANCANTSDIKTNNYELSKILKMSPLHAAVKLGNLPLLLKVIYYDENANKIESQMKKAIKIAEKNGQEEIAACVSAWLSNYYITKLLESTRKLTSLPS